MRTIDVPLRMLARVDFRSCALRVDARSATFDRDSDCFKAIRAALQLSCGAGDTIAKVAEAFGVTPCATCSERRAQANELFPYATARLR